MLASSSKFYIVSTVLFSKHGGANVGVKNYASQFSMFVPTNINLKMANGNMGHDQVIGIVLYLFPNLSII